MKPKHDFEKFPIGTNFENIIVNKDRSSTELVLIKCYQCMGNNHSRAYKCDNISCPLYPVNNKFMRKPHKLKEETKIKFINQLNNYRNGTK